MYGFNGKILRIDLAEGKIIEEDLPEKVVKRFLGGRGLASWFLHNEVPAGTDPLGLENKLIFFSGLLIRRKINQPFSTKPVTNKSPTTLIASPKSTRCSA